MQTVLAYCPAPWAVGMQLLEGRYWHVSRHAGNLGAIRANGTRREGLPARCLIESSRGSNTALPTLKEESRFRSVGGNLWLNNRIFHQDPC
jgi:hypothetical protein